MIDGLRGVEEGLAEPDLFYLLNECACREALLGERLEAVARCTYI